jgi:methyl-accepting chemotaxis protein
MGASVSKMDEVMSEMGASVSKMNEVMSEMGASVPKMNEVMSEMGASVPKMNEVMSGMERAIPLIHEGLMRVRVSMGRLDERARRLGPSLLEFRAVVFECETPVCFVSATIAVIEARKGALRPSVCLI